nr:HNH endonuclease [Clostridium tyrobutyricum]
MDQYGFDSITFHKGEPDFSEISKGQVEIDDFTDSRDSNFDQADEKLAEQKGCTPEEVAKWREENKYTWHECRDCKTMQKAPTEVHGNISHSGGVSEYKSQAKEA